MGKCFNTIVLILSLFLICSCEKKEEVIPVIENNGGSQNNANDKDNEGSQDNDDNQDNGDSTSESSPTTPDPSGTKTAILSSNMNTIYVSGTLYDDSGIYYSENLIRTNRGNTQIADLGEFANLGSVKWHITNLWYTSAVAQINHGYVVKVPDFYGNVTYCRIYITNAIIGLDGSVAGIEIKYEYDWEEPFLTPVDFDIDNISGEYFEIDADSNHNKMKYSIIQIPYTNPVNPTAISYETTDKRFLKVESDNNALYVFHDITDNSLNSIPWEIKITVSNDINKKMVILNNNTSIKKGYFYCRFGLD